MRVVHRLSPGVLAGLTGDLRRFLYGLGIYLLRGTPGYGWRCCHRRGDIQRREGNEPVFVGALAAVFPLHIVIIKAVFFFDEFEIDQNIDVAHDRPAVQASAVGDRLVAGKALVGFAVAEGEKRRVGCPDRAGKQGDVAFGYLFKPDPVIFCLFAGFGFGGVTVASGCAHGIITFPSTPLYATVKGLTFGRCNDWRGVQGPEAFSATKPLSFRAGFFLPSFLISTTGISHLFVKAYRKNSPLPKSRK